MTTINRNTNFVFYSSRQFSDDFKLLEPADEETKKEVMELLKEHKINVMGGMYLANLPNKNLQPIYIGYRFWDNGIQEITKIEAVSKAIVLITHKEIIE